MKFLIPTAKEMTENEVSSLEDLPSKAQPIISQLAALSYEELSASL